MTVAQTFAKTPVDFDTKAEWLAIPPSLSWQLGSVQSAAMKERLRDVLSGVDHRRQLGYKGIYNLLLGHAGASVVKRDRATTLARMWACDRIANGDHALGRSLLAVWGVIRVDPSNYRRSLLSLRAVLKRAGRDAEGIRTSGSVVMPKVTCIPA